jgi:hypothetical protein
MKKTLNIVVRIFKKKSGEGLTEPPPQTPSRQISGFALDSGFALNSETLRAFYSGFPNFAPTSTSWLRH